VLAHLAIKLTSAQLAPRLMPLWQSCSQSGKSTLIREGALTGLRGKEAAFAKVLASQLTKDNGAKARD
jgi:hypothetical protein